jgi:hypothetical protein
MLSYHGALFTGVDREKLANSMRGNAAWGSPAFRAMTWRKWELVQDLLLQMRPARLQPRQRESLG